MTGYRLFPSTSGPGSSTSHSGNVVMGAVFEVTAPNYSLAGFYWWVADSAQAAATPTAALWKYSGSWSYVTTSHVSFGTLTAGQWNYAALGTPIVLTSGIQYVAAVGFSNNFPVTTNQFGSAQPYAAGITNGPLTAYSDTGGSNGASSGQRQMAFTFASNDPTANFPNNVTSASNYWIDVQINPASSGLLAASFP